MQKTTFITGPTNQLLSF